MASPSFTYDLFISHAGEDKNTIAFPLREMLLKHGIRAFVDEKDMRGGTQSINAMNEAMKTAAVGVVILSPEFVAREWPMKELLCFLRRNEKPLGDELPMSKIIPLFYRLSIKELDREPQVDRLDAKGEKLYTNSRFFERQARGEPEADIANIKTALQKLRAFMGIENYCNASNESSSEMYKRREDLLNRLCEEILRALKDKADQFRCHYHKEKNKILSGLVLDFDCCKDEGNTTPIEAEVLQAVLDNSKKTNVISLQGIGGVGKSSILQGLSNLDVIKRRYKDGIHFMSLGADATRNRLIKSLYKVVRDTGGADKAVEMIKLENYRDVFAAFESWFSDKHCLFMLDNVWETAEISLAIIDEFATLDLFSSNSKLLFTTRRTDIAAEAETRFVVQTRKPLSFQCRKILLLSADIEIDNCNEADSRAVKEILTKCSGLPLFLKIAGKAVKAENDKLRNRGCFAYRHYAAKLHARLQQFLNTPVGSYERLSSTLDISVQLVDDRKGGWGFGSHVSAAQMYRRLSTLLRQSSVPMSTLKNLWELDSEDEATIAAEEFERVGLATLEIEDEASNHADTLSLHDSLHTYAVLQMEKHGETKLGHSILVTGYGRRLEIEDGCRAWWSAQLEADGYVHRHLCSHLVLAGLEEEILKLLLRPEWTIRCFMECGILDLERDYRLGVTTIKKIEEEKHKDQDHQHGRVRANEKAIALQMVAEATRLSCGFRIRHPRELCFQLHGRLSSCAIGTFFIKKYLVLLEIAATKLWGPWMRCLSHGSPVLTPPGGATKRIRFVGSPIVCMALSDERDCVLCGCSDGVVVAVDLSSLEVTKQWFTSFERTCDVFFSDDRKFIFSKSEDGSAQVYETRTAVLRLTLHNAEDLKCAAVTSDGRLVMAGWDDGTVQTRILKSGRELLAPFRVHVGRILCLAALSDGEHFVSGGEDMKLRIWSVNAREQIGEVFVGHTASIICVSVMPRKRYIASGSVDGSVRIWDIGKRSQVAILRTQFGSIITCIAIGADGKRVTFGTLNNIVGEWNVEQGDETCRKLRNHTDSVTGVMFHPDGNSIISCSSDGTIRVSDLGRMGMKPEQSVMNRLVARRRGYWQPTGLPDAAFTSDRRYLVSQSATFDIVLYDASSGVQETGTLRGHAEEIMWGVVFPGRRLVAFYRDRTVGFWMPHWKFGRFCKIGEDIRVGAVDMSGDPGFWIRYESEKSISLNIALYELPFPRNMHPSQELTITISEWQDVSIAANVRIHDLSTGQTTEGKNGRFLFRYCRFIDRQSSETYRETMASAVCLIGRDVWYVREEQRLLLGTLEACATHLKFNPNEKTILLRRKRYYSLSLRLEL